jgi:cobalt-precorrin-5B (C1)-methyltransferase
VFVGMAGKLTKLAAGVLMTHYTRSAVDPGLLGRLTTQAGGSAELAGEVTAANTARHAYELWETAGLLRPAGDLLCGAVAEVLTRFVDGALEAEVAMVDFAGSRCVAATRADWVSEA